MSSSKQVNSMEFHFLVILYWAIYLQSYSFVKKVLRCCGLIEDLQRLPEGDLTRVKKGGENLSGGQRQRIGLARAVYKNASIYLLDDPLSAIDPCLRQKIFDKVIN